TRSSTLPGTSSPERSLRPVALELTLRGLEGRREPVERVVQRGPALAAAEAIEDRASALGRGARAHHREQSDEGVERARRLGAVPAVERALGLRELRGELVRHASEVAIEKIASVGADAPAEIGGDLAVDEGAVVGRHRLDGEILEQVFEPPYREG